MSNVRAKKLMFSFGLSQALEKLLDKFQGCEDVGKSVKAEHPPSIGTLRSLTPPSPQPTVWSIVFPGEPTARQRLWGFFLGSLCIFTSQMLFELSSLISSKSQQGTLIHFKCIFLNGPKRREERQGSTQQAASNHTNQLYSTWNLSRSDEFRSRWFTWSFTFCVTFSSSPGCLQTHDIALTALQLLLLQPPHLMFTNTLGGLITIQNAVGWKLLQWKEHSYSFDFEQAGDYDYRCLFSHNLDKPGTFFIRSFSFSLTDN